MSQRGSVLDARTSARLSAATADVAGPVAVVDLDAFEANAVDLVHRAGGTPVRVASKSVRVRGLLDDVLARPGWAGVMAYSLAEALWLAEHGHTDVLVGYPSVDRASLARLAASPEARSRITLMVDDGAQLALLPRLGSGGSPVQVCLDVDASWRVGPVHLGARRSPVHTPAEAAALARACARTGGVEVRGLMFYEAQVAGLPDVSPAVRFVKRRSIADLATRRAAVLDAVTAALGYRPPLVNSGGTGSLESSSADPVVTEVTAGSGLLLPALFDGYRNIRPRPAAFLGLDIVRRPAPGLVTVFAGGYPASGPAGRSRLPRVVGPPGARLLRAEGAGEVQTPVRLPAGVDVGVGERLWFRHAKAGELMERVREVHLVRGDAVVGTLPTYRGEGRAFW